MQRTTPSTLSWLAAAALLAAFGCRSGDYGAAAAGLGAGVITAGVLRATTGTCWARCGAGAVCNRESGLCEAGECYPACPVGQSCARELDGSLHCADDPTVFRPGATATSAPPATGSAAVTGAAAVASSAQATSAPPGTSATPAASSASATSAVPATAGRAAAIEAPSTIGVAGPSAAPVP